MEYQFQLQVLTNNVECMEKNLKMLLQQFINLQDFLKLEFGSRFTEFCNSSRNVGGPAVEGSHSFQNLNRATDLPASYPLHKLEEESFTSKSLPRRQTSQKKETTGYFPIEDESEAEIIVGDDNDDNESISFIFEGTGRSEDSVDAMNDDSSASQEKFQDDISNSEMKEAGVDVGDNEDGNDDDEYLPQKYRSVKQLRYNFACVEDKHKVKCLRCESFISNRKDRRERHLKLCTGKKRPDCYRDNVRDYFERLKIPNSKAMKSKCNKCSSYCSDKAGRLRLHLKTCDPTAFASLVQNTSYAKTNSRTSLNGVAKDENIQSSSCTTYPEITDSGQEMTDSGH